jgi:hypothetical protein
MPQPLDQYVQQYAPKNQFFKQHGFHVPPSPFKQQLPGKTRIHHPLFLTEIHPQ